MLTGACGRPVLRLGVPQRINSFPLMMCKQDEDAKPWKHHMMQWFLLYVILFPLSKCSGLGN